MYEPGQVIRPAPRRRQEDGVGGGERRHDVEKVADNELDPVFDAVDPGVVSREADLVRVDVDGDHALASERKLCRKKLSLNIRSHKSNAACLLTFG